MGQFMNPNTYSAFINPITALVPAVAAPAAK